MNPEENQADTSQPPMPVDQNQPVEESVSAVQPTTFQEPAVEPSNTLAVEDTIVPEVASFSPETEEMMVSPAEVVETEPAPVSALEAPTVIIEDEPVASPEVAAPIAPPMEAEPASTPDSTTPIIAPQSTTDPQPGGQKPIANKKKGLFIGIIIGAVVLIAAALLYFFWWSNPEKMITDGVMSVFNAKTVATNTEASIKYQGGTVTMKVASVSKADSSKATIDFSFKAKDSDPIALKLEGVVADNGVVYVKADGIRKAVEDAVKMMAQMSTTQNQLSSPYSSQQQTQAYVQQMATQMLQALDPIIKKVDSRWIKIDPSDLSDSEGSIGTMQKCLTDTMKKFNEDPAMRDEVTKAYRDNPFLIAKRGVTVEGYKGAVGFELDMGDTTQKNAEAFGKQVSESKLAKELKKCQGTTDTSNGSTNDTTANGDQPATTIRMWVTPLTHQLKRVEMVAKGDNLDTSPTAVSEVTVAADFELNAPQTVEIPKDATSLKDLQKEIEEVMQNIYGVTPQSTQSSSTLYTI